MERLYQYLWKHSMLGQSLMLSDGRQVKILNPGILNENSGPDFSGAKIRIGDTVWCGNVEIHVKASDWYRHHHDTDPAYDGVILHVVAIDDKRVKRTDGSNIPQVGVTFPEEFYRLYLSLADKIRDVRCRYHIPLLSKITIEDWLSSLAVERMQQKSQHILSILQWTQGDWERTCFIAFARALGFGLNSEPFEMMARSLPLNILAHHSDSIFQIEALLFGQAGMLDMSQHIFDEYYQSLCREYYFLSRKYGLRPLRNDMWKYSKTRPGNLPHRRIAMLAQYLYGGFSLMADIIASNGIEERARELFAMDLDGYWKGHHRFGSETQKAPVSLTKGSEDLLLINLVAPLIYAYSAHTGDYVKGEQAFSLWIDIDAEHNTFIRQWQACGIKCEDAMHSQALLQLRKTYCDAGRCLDCRFGHSFLRKTIKSK